MHMKVGNKGLAMFCVRNADHLTAWIVVGGEFLSPDAAGVQTDGVVFVM